MEDEDGEGLLVLEVLGGLARMRGRLSGTAARASHYKRTERVRDTRKEKGGLHTYTHHKCPLTLEPDGVVDQVQDVGNGIVLSHFDLLAVCRRKQGKTTSSVGR